MLKELKKKHRSDKHELVFNLQNLTLVTNDLQLVV